MGFHDCAVIRFMESRGFTFILGFYSVMYDRISLKPQHNRITVKPHNRITPSYILSSCLSCLSWADLNCEGVIPVTLLNCVLRYATLE